MHTVTKLLSNTGQFIVGIILAMAFIPIIIVMTVRMAYNNATKH